MVELCSVPPFSPLRPLEYSGFSLTTFAESLEMNTNPALATLTWLPLALGLSTLILGTLLFSSKLRSPFLSIFEVERVPPFLHDRTNDQSTQILGTDTSYDAFREALTVSLERSDPMKPFRLAVGIPMLSYGLTLPPPSCFSHHGFSIVGSCHPS